MTQRKVAIVSGGSRGIGRATVLRLAANGHDVAFCYASRADAAREVEKSASELGARTLAIETDVTDLDAVRQFVAAAEDHLGPIDVAVASAGIVRDGPVLMMSDEDWNHVVDVNLTGAFHLSRAVVFSMMKRKTGCIVNLSSVAGVYGNPTQANYSASKAGIVGFTKAFAKEVGSYGIRVNVVAPGFIDTDMTGPLTDRTKERALAAIPLQRFGKPDEVADLITFLVSDRAAYITGSVLNVDGGIVL